MRLFWRVHWLLRLPECSRRTASMRRTGSPNTGPPQRSSRLLLLLELLLELLLLGARDSAGAAEAGEAREAAAAAAPRAAGDGCRLLELLAALAPEGCWGGAAAEGSPAAARAESARAERSARAGLREKVLEGEVLERERERVALRPPESRERSMVGRGELFCLSFSPGL